MYTKTLMTCVLCFLLVGTAGATTVSGTLSGTYTSTTTFVDTSTAYDVTAGTVTISGSIDISNIGGAMVEIGLLDPRVYHAYVDGVLPDGSPAPASFGSTFNSSATALFLGDDIRLKDDDPESQLVTGNASGIVDFIIEIVADNSAVAPTQWQGTAGAYTPAPVGTQRMSLDGGATWKNYVWGAWRHAGRDAFFDASPWSEPELTYNGGYLAVTVYGATGGDIDYDVRAQGTPFGAPPVPEPASMTLLGLGLAGLGMRRFRKRG